MSPDVAFISPYPRTGTTPDGRAGVARYTANLANALADHGLKPIVLAPHEDGEPDRSSDNGVDVLRCFTSGKRNAVAEALATADELDVSVVHLQHELFLYGGAGTLAGLFTGLARSRHRPTVVTMHQVVRPGTVTEEFTRMHRVGVPPQVARFGLRTLQHSLPRLADATIVHEHAFAQSVPGARVIPHGVADPCSVQPAEQSAARARLGLSGERLIALCFGFLAPYKGLETALDAAVLTSDDIEVVVAGGVHPRLAERSDDYAFRLQQRYGDVARFTGYVPDELVSDWFRACDVVLLPYPAPHAASGPLALALAHHRPVLLSPPMAAASSAPLELSCPGGAVGFASRLRELRNDPMALDELAAATAQLADDRTWSAVAQAHQEIYEEVAHGSSLAGWRLRAA
ncbi:MAG TPA: glycosyltransferase [Jatrophihabitans sp.]